MKPILFFLAHEGGGGGGHSGGHGGGGEHSGGHAGGEHKDHDQKEHEHKDKEPKEKDAKDKEHKGGEHADGSKKAAIGSDDSILNLAKEAGFYWSTIWNHPENSHLKSKRQKPEVLKEGDEVHIPKPEPKKVSKPNEARHKFKLKGEQAKFKIRLKQMGQPRANEDYELVIDGEIKTGKTDADGKIELDVPNDAKGGVLKLQNGKEKIPINIGRLDPDDSISGVFQRLKNLGFTPDPEDAEDEMPKSMLKAFQAKNKLPVTGKHDGATKGKIKELHQA